MIKKTDKGFTLVELLVVISIISLLSSVILSSLSSARSKARDSIKIQAMEEYKKALNLFFSDKGYYPGSLDSLVPTYISEIRPDLVNYIGRNNITYVQADEGGTCGDQCPSYRINVKLEDGSISTPPSDVYDYKVTGNGTSIYGSPNGNYVYGGPIPFNNGARAERVSYFIYNNGTITWSLWSNGRQWFLGPLSTIGYGDNTWTNGTWNYLVTPNIYTPLDGVSGTVTISAP